MSDVIPPPSLTWNLKRSSWKRRFLLETIIFRFHVKLWGGTDSRRWIKKGKSSNDLKHACKAAHRYYWLYLLKHFERVSCYMQMVLSHTTTWWLWYIMMIIIIIIIILTLILRQDNLARHKDQEMTCLALSQLVCVFKHLTSLLIEQHVLGVLKNEAANASAHKLSSAILIHVASLQQPWIIPTCFPFLRESSRTQHPPKRASWSAAIVRKAWATWAL